MTLKRWQDPCYCASFDGFTCMIWKELFKIKCKNDDEEHSFGLSLLCCPCSFISLSCFLPFVVCKEYQVYHTKKETQDVLIVEQPTRYNSITNEEPINTSINEDNESLNESLYYEKSNPIPILCKKPKTRLTII